MHREARSSLQVTRFVFALCLTLNDIIRKKDFFLSNLSDSCVYTTPNICIEMYTDVCQTIPLIG